MFIMIMFIRCKSWTVGQKNIIKKDFVQNMDEIS